MGNAYRHLYRNECTGILLQALGVTPQASRHILRRLHAEYTEQHGVARGDLDQHVVESFPATEAEFQTMCSTLRQWYHLRKNAPHHLAFARQPNDRSNALPAELNGMIYVVSQPDYDPWSTADPWGGGTHSLRQSPLTTHTASQQPSPVMHGMWVNYNQQQNAATAAAAAAPATTEPPQASPAHNNTLEWGQHAESVADTDSNTESSLGEEINYNTPEFAGLTHPQISEKLWWNMARSKSMWRKHMHKPVRKTRRFFKKAFPQIR